MLGTVCKSALLNAIEWRGQAHNLVLSCAVNAATQDKHELIIYVASQRIDVCYAVIDSGVAVSASS